MNPTQKSNGHAWIDLFVRLGDHGPPSMETLERITAPGVHFRDPFNDVRGREHILRLFEHTYRAVKRVRFDVKDVAWSTNGMYLKWGMNGELAVIGPWRVEGMSEVTFDDNGQIMQHLDYWDAADQFYARLPLIGWILRKIRSRAAIS